MNLDSPYSPNAGHLPWWLHVPLGIAAIASASMAVWVSRPIPTPPLQKLPETTVVVVRSGPASASLQPLTGGNSLKSATVPGSPSSIVVTADGSKAFLLDTNHGDVVPVDLVKGLALPSIQVGKLPVDEHLSADGKTLYITDNLDASVIPITTLTDKPQPAEALVSGADGFFPAPNGTAAVTVYTASGEPGLFYFLDPSAGLGSPVQAGSNPILDLHFGADGKTAWLLESGIGSSPGQLIPVDVATRTVGNPILVGHGPSASTVTTDGKKMVVPNSLDGTVSVVDLTQRAVVATVAVGSLPETPFISSDNMSAWVPCQLDKTLVQVDLTANQVGSTVGLDKPPTAIALSSSTGQAWVLFQSSDGSVSPLGTSSRSFGTPISVGNSPNMVISHDGKMAWVANGLSDSVQSVDLAHNKNGPPIAVAKAPAELAFTQHNQQLLVLSFGDGTHNGFLTAINTGTGVAGLALAVGPSPSSLTIAPNGKTAFVAIHQNNSIAVVNLSLWTVSIPIALSCSPTGLQITPDGQTLYAACANSALVVPINATTLEPGTAISVSANPTLVMGNTGKLLYVVGAHNVRAISTVTNHVVAAQEESNNIVSLQPMPDDKTLLAIDNSGGMLLTLNGATLKTTKSLALTSRPDLIRLNQDGSLAFVLDTTKQEFYLVQTAAWVLAATIDVSPNAQGLAVPQRQ